VLIALLAVCRKLIILDLGEADAMHMFAYPRNYRARLCLSASAVKS